MPAKNKKTKRYSCELCTRIDNALMVECENCQAKFHLKCLNIKSVDEDEDWICSDCQEKSATRPSKSINHEVSTKQADYSKPQEDNSKFARSQYESERKSNVEDGRSTNNQGQDYVSLRTSQRSHNTHSSLGQKTQLELDRLEEERQLRERRDKEYLDSKYRILLEDCSNKTDRTGSERHSTDRSSYTRDWVQRQRIARPQDAPQIPPSESKIIQNKSQIPIKGARIPQDESQMTLNASRIPPNKPTIPPTVNPGDNSIIWEDKQRFARRIDEITVDGTSTSPVNRRKQLTALASRLNRELNEELDKPGLSGSTEPKAVPIKEQESHFTSRLSKINPPNTQTRNTVPCPAHDASQFMAQGRGMSNRNSYAGIPCSNSTFAVPQNSNDHVTNNRVRDQHLYTTTIEPTLEWDNFVGTQHEWEKYPKPRPNLSQVKPSKSATMQSKVRKDSDSRLDLSEDRSTVFWKSVDKLRSSNPSKQEIESFFMDLQSKTRDREENHVSSDDQSQSELEYHQPSFNKRNYDDDTLYVSNGERFMPNRRSTSDQSHRKVKFDETENCNPDMSNRLSLRGRPTPVRTVEQASGGITPDQLAARHVVERKLPIFAGDPKEWQIWYHQYKNSTSLCGFTNGENLDRLQKCLRGKAKDVVRGRLIHPDSVPWIIETLQLLYGRPEVIVKAIIDEIRESPPLKSDKLEDLMDFAFEVQTICTTIESLECVNHLPDPMLIEALVNKLPVQEKKDWAKYKVGKSNVTLKTLSDWLYEMAKVLSTVASPRTIKSNERKPEKEKVDRNEKAIGLERVNFHVNQAANEAGTDTRKQNENYPRKKFPCQICKNECNKVEECSKFKSFSIDARWKSINDNKLCRRCLRKHKDPCRAKSVCGKNGCQYKQHFLLHNDERHPPQKYAPNTTVASNHLHTAISISTMLRIVPVTLYNGIKSIATFAFLDDGTTVTMMEKWLAEELGLSGSTEQLCLIWTKKIHRRERAERVSLEISGIGDFNRRYEMKGVRTVDELNLPVQTVNKAELVDKYPYLRDVPFADFKNAIPGIMIGSDMPKFGAQLHVIESPEVENDQFNGPMASKTRLGWSIHGPQNGSTIKEYVNAHQFEICPHHNELDNEIHQRVKEYFSIENFGVQANSRTKLESKDDERALEMLERLTNKKNGKYETGLLWKGDNTELPDSFPMAMKRLISLEKQGPEVIRTIGAKIADYVAKGYARKLSAEELKYEGPVWYLPPFGVVHPKKPEKLRMVFDAAAKVKSTSLNSALLKGPDLYTSLVDILRRFRERRYTGGGDIQEMYHQVSIIEKDRRFQRFLFRDNKNQEPSVYELDVMSFGAICSPSSAQFVKNKNATEFKETHPRAVSAIIDNHYVDDMMDCEHTEEKMIELMEDVKMIHASGGFKIRNFISNSEKVLKALGEAKMSEFKDISLKTELKVERVLGMWYNTKSDVFTFSLKYTPIDKEILNGRKLPTKREILRILMSIFDPLGLLSNYLIYLKILLQEVWRTQMDWDEQISSQVLVERWKRWLSILSEVENVRVPRLYSLKMSPGVPKSIQMHVFVDAGEDAFAATVYFRVEDDDGVDCALVGSKARVAPLKYLSIPRKELQASVLGTRLSASIKSSQRFKIDRRIIWTDSATVVSWLNSDHRKYSQFVAHRVGEILENSDVNEWRWIPTKENVADEATKWTKTPNFDPSNRWFNGPEFLRLSEDKWPERKTIKIDTEEEMKANFVHSSFLIPQIIDPERFSQYKRMVRSLAYAIRFINLCTGKAKKGEPLNQDELCKAEQLIFRQAQFEGYASEMVTLERNKVLPADKQKFIEKPSPLYDGTPYLDAEGVLRMKFRTDGVRELSMDTIRPIVLPKDSRITKLLLLDYHTRCFHQFHETVVNEVRQRFYIPKLRVTAKKARKLCQMCRNHETYPNPPQMANLPHARLAIRFVPYSYVGIDFFGPMYVTVGRRTEKRWGVLFTCLTIRAIHIEIAPGLDTNSCILCIQNFIADHGPVIEFHSDCGTNFKGTDNVLQQEISKIDPERLKTEFTTTYTKWIFNPPASAHMGGSWERLIGIVKSAIDEVMPTRTPKEDMLRNLLKQIQNIVNSRPLTYIPLDVEEDEALTPNHFIKLSSNGLKPPCEIDLDGPYLRESWKESQRLTELFWKRFVKEYLPTLARRTKWYKPVAPLKEGDLVLIVDENSPRNTYPKARILRTEMGSNGQVRRAKVEIIQSTKSNSDGQIIKVTKSELWRSAHKLALLDVAFKTGLAEPGVDPLVRETGGSVGATKFKSNIGAPSLYTDQTATTE